MAINKEKRLTKAEEELMHLFWKTGHPLTSVEILEASQDKSWNGNYLHKMLRALQKEGFLEVCGMIQYGNKYARQFMPTLSMEEYAANLLSLQGVGMKAFAKIALALVKNEKMQNGLNQAVDDNETLIKDLEKIIENFAEKEED